MKLIDVKNEDIRRGSVGLAKKGKPDIKIN